MKLNLIRQYSNSRSEKSEKHQQDEPVIHSQRTNATCTAFIFYNVLWSDFRMRYINPSPKGKELTEIKQIIT
jgi:hypothetical protein